LVGTIPSSIKFLYACFCYNILYFPKEHVMQFDGGERVGAGNGISNWGLQRVPRFMESTDKAIDLEMPLNSLSGEITISFN